MTLNDTRGKRQEMCLGIRPTCRLIFNDVENTRKLLHTQQKCDIVKAEDTHR